MWLVATLLRLLIDLQRERKLLYLKKNLFLYIFFNKMRKLSNTIFFFEPESLFINFFLTK